MTETDIEYVVTWESEYGTYAMPEKATCNYDEAKKLARTLQMEGKRKVGIETRTSIITYTHEYLEELIK